MKLLLPVGKVSLTLVVLSSALSFANSGVKHPVENAIKDTSLQTPETHLPLPENLIRMRLFRQSTDYTCGVAALQSILYYYDPAENWTEEDLARELKSNPTDGTLTKEIAAFAKRVGFTVQAKTNMGLESLKTNLDERRPVLILMQAWSTRSGDWSSNWENGHFVVAVGYDKHNLYFMDPGLTGHYTYVPLDEFMERWHDIDGSDRLNQFGLILEKNHLSPKPARAVRMN